MDLKLTGHLVSGQLVRANLTLARAFTERLKGMGLYLGQELILLSLQEEDGMTQSQLASRHCVDLSTITKVIQRMERSDLVVRRADPADARISRVYLTARGRDLCESCWQVWMDMEQQLTQGLSEAERVLLHRLLSAIASNMEE
jgi:DNA-binding MarR family transcriptional regulator